MENFEKKLMEMKVPVLDNDPLEHELRRELLDRYFSPVRKYRRNSRFAFGFAGVLVVLMCTIVLNPRIAYELNSFAYREEKFSRVVGRGDAGFERDDMTYTSIYNPELAKKIDPGKYEEDTAFIIRRYTSPDEGSIMIVSEFDQEERVRPARHYYDGI